MQGKYTGLCQVTTTIPESPSGPVVPKGAGLVSGDAIVDAMKGKITSADIAGARPCSPVDIRKSSMSVEP